jgi:hypothetical protein
MPDIVITPKLLKSMTDFYEQETQELRKLGVVADKKTARLDGTTHKTQSKSGANETARAPRQVAAKRR